MGTTTTHQIPYPEATEPADVPVDMRELAERVDAVVGMCRIADITVSTPVSAIDLPSIPATYTHLLLKLFLRTDLGAAGQFGLLRMNGDVTNNYNSERLSASAATVAAAETLAGSGIGIGDVAHTASAAFRLSVHEISIPNYRSAHDKHAHGQAFLPTSDVAGGTQLFSFAGVWKAQAVVDRLTVVVTGNPNFQTGARATLYGLI